MKVLGPQSGGRFKTQFETNTSGGMLGPSSRADAEEHLFSYPHSLDPKKRPVYGFTAKDATGILKIACSQATY